MMNGSSTDFSELFKRISTIEKYPPLEIPHIGVDECFNRPEIVDLMFVLFRKGLANGGSPLWNEMRVRSDGRILSVTGGIPSNMKDRLSSHIGDIGQPRKYNSFNDYQVMQSLVAHFDTYDKLVLLTENVRNNQNGLRRLLNEQVKPAISQSHNNRLLLAVLFKKGKTSIDDYCSKVVEFFEGEDFGVGYSQHFI